MAHNYPVLYRQELAGPRNSGAIAGMLHQLASSTASKPQTVNHVAHTLRKAEIPLVAALLGALNAELAGGLDFHRVPIDAAVGGVGLALGLLQAGEDISHEWTNAGMAGLSVFAYRKTDAWLRARRAAGSSTVHGEGSIGVDPILDAARNL